VNNNIANDLTILYDLFYFVTNILNSFESILGLR